MDMLMEVYVLKPVSDLSPVSIAVVSEGHRGDSGDDGELPRSR